MRELTEEEVSKLAHGRLLRSESHALLPLLTKRKDAAVSKLLASFKGGKQEMLMTGVAELCALTDLETDMIRNMRETEQLERRLYDEKE